MVTVAMNGSDGFTFLRERERERRGRGRVERSRGLGGRRGTRRRRPGHRQKQEVAGVWLRAPATRLSSSWREEEDDWQWPVGWAELGQARATGKFLSLSFLFFYLFYYFYNFRALLKMPGHFQKS